MNTTLCDQSREYLIGHKNKNNYLIFTKNQDGLKCPKTSKNKGEKKYQHFLLGGR